MKTHFDPYATEQDDIDVSITSCGIRAGEEYNPTASWEDVDCKRCLAMRARLQKEFDESEAEICRGMGQAADYFQSQEECHDA